MTRFYTSGILEYHFYIKPILFFLFFTGCLFPVSVSGQLDSLRKLIPSDEGFQHDSLEIKARYLYAVELSKGMEDSFDIAIAQLDIANGLAKKNALIEKQIQIQSHKGYVQLRIGEFEKSLLTYDEALNLAQFKKLELTAARIKDKKSKVYLRMKKDDLSLSLKLQALDVFQEFADSNAISECYSGIAGLYVSKGEFEQCVKYGHLALKTHSKNASSDISAFVTGNMAMAYKRLNQPDTALYYFMECRALSKDIFHLHRDNELELARFYVTQDKHNEAIKIFEDLIALYPKNSTSYSLHYYRLQYALYLQMQHHFDKSAKILVDIDLASIKERPRDLYVYYKISSRLNYESGNYKTARNHFRKYRDYGDKLRDINVKSNFKEIEEKYNVAEKEKVIATQSLALRNRLISIISLIAVLGIGTVLFLLRQRRLKFAKAIAEQTAKVQASEIDNLRKENKIISMQSMLEGQEEERLRIARDLHDNIGSMMTTIKLKVLEIQKNIRGIEKMNIAGELDGMINTASQEIRRISHRMTPVALEIAGLEGAVLDLEQQLHENNISLKKDIHQLSEITNKNLAINIYRIIQEIVNNTIKHSRATEMQIIANLEMDVLSLHIGDNGIGFNDSLKESKSIGLSGIQSRISYLNGTYTIDSKDNTLYKIDIPLHFDS